MLRVILTFSLIFYVLYKLGFFRVFSGGVREGYEDQARANRRPPNSNVNVDSIPKEKTHRTDSKEGEYIDYEEVK